MSNEKLLEKARQWFDVSFSDLRAAVAMRDAGIYNSACFMAQQAVEKAMKGTLIATGIDPARTHSIELLSKQLGEGNESLSALSPERLDRHYIAPRSPEALTEGSSISKSYKIEDADDAIRVAHGVVYLLGDWAEELGVSIPLDNRRPTT
ncbi:HEPN domain-containing protein [Acidithiobacillus sp. IBUN Pt1247-S3]|uniref:HEPN domain-containing protein n=1 Tax=Acidithiobacillus sp. IBUN Pt1247-S3 TaxID=3166642 RepID=UPI0034E444ED